jgi:hypothetical protein
LGRRWQALLSGDAFLSESELQQRLPPLRAGAVTRGGKVGPGGGVAHDWNGAGSSAPGRGGA